MHEKWCLKLVPFSPDTVCVADKYNSQNINLFRTTLADDAFCYRISQSFLFLAENASVDPPEGFGISSPPEPGFVSVFVGFTFAMALCSIGHGLSIDLYIGVCEGCRGGPGGHSALIGSERMGGAVRLPRIEAIVERGHGNRRRPIP